MFVQGCCTRFNAGSNSSLRNALIQCSICHWRFHEECLAAENIKIKEPFRCFTCSDVAILPSASPASMPFQNVPCGFIGTLAVSDAVAALLVACFTKPPPGDSDDISPPSNCVLCPAVDNRLSLQIILAPLPPSIFGTLFSSYHNVFGVLPSLQNMDVLSLVFVKLPSSWESSPAMLNQLTGLIGLDRTDICLVVTRLTGGGRLATVSYSDQSGDVIIQELQCPGAMVVLNGEFTLNTERFFICSKSDNGEDPEAKDTFLLTTHMLPSQVRIPPLVTPDALLYSYTGTVTGRVVPITHGDVGRLLRKSYINDDLMELLLDLLISPASENSGDLPTGSCVCSERVVYIFSSQFMTKLMEPTEEEDDCDPYAQVDRWNENMFRVVVLLIPICHHLHWSLAVVIPGSRSIYHYDSLSSGHAGACIPPLQGYLHHKWRDCLGMDTTWNVHKTKSPQQPNMRDCGLYALLNARGVLRVVASTITNYEEVDDAQYAKLHEKLPACFGAEVGHVYTQQDIDLLRGSLDTYIRDLAEAAGSFGDTHCAVCNSLFLTHTAAIKGMHDCVPCFYRDMQMVMTSNLPFSLQSPVSALGTIEIPPTTLKDLTQKLTKELHRPVEDDLNSNQRSEPSTLSSSGVFMVWCHVTTGSLNATFGSSFSALLRQILEHKTQHLGDMFPSIQDDGNVQSLTLLTANTVFAGDTTTATNWFKGACANARSRVVIVVIRLNTLGDGVCVKYKHGNDAYAHSLHVCGATLIIGDMTLAGLKSFTLTTNPPHPFSSLILLYEEKNEELNKIRMRFEDTYYECEVQMQLRDGNFSVAFRGENGEISSATVCDSEVESTLETYNYLDEKWQSATTFDLVCMILKSPDHWNSVIRLGRTGNRVMVALPASEDRETEGVLMRCSKCDDAIDDLYLSVSGQTNRGIVITCADCERRPVRALSTIAFGAIQTKEIYASQLVFVALGKNFYRVIKTQNGETGLYTVMVFTFEGPSLIASRTTQTTLDPKKVIGQSLTVRFTDTKYGANVISKDDATGLFYIRYISDGTYEHILLPDNDAAITTGDCKDKLSSDFTVDITCDGPFPHAVTVCDCLKVDLSALVVNQHTGAVDISSAEMRSFFPGECTLMVALPVTRSLLRELRQKKKSQNLRTPLIRSWNLDPVSHACDLRDTGTLQIKGKYVFNLNIADTCTAQWIQALPHEPAKVDLQNSADDGGSIGGGAHLQTKTMSAERIQDWVARVNQLVLNVPEDSKHYKNYINKEKVRMLSSMYIVLFLPLCVTLPLSRRNSIYQIANSATKTASSSPSMDSWEAAFCYVCTSQPE